MAERKLQQKGVATFVNMSITKGKVVNLKFKMRYDELVTSVNLLQGLNSNIQVMAKCGIKRPRALGEFTLGGLSFDKDGNATIPLKSMVENVNLDAICELVDAEEIVLKFKAKIEIEDKSKEDTPLIEETDNGEVIVEGKEVEENE